jgi:hypothetical protein
MREGHAACTRSPVGRLDGDVSADCGLLATEPNYWSMIGAEQQQRSSTRTNVYLEKHT